MKLKDFLEKNREGIELIEIIGENYYYRCTDVNRVILDENRFVIGKLTLTLDGEPTLNGEINEKQKIFVYVYKDFSIKFTLKKPVRLLKLLKEKRENILKVEVFGDNFYYVCNDNSKISFNGDSTPIILNLEGFIVSLEREDVLKEALEQSDGSYSYNYKNFELKLTITKNLDVIRPKKAWEEFKSFLIKE